MLSIFNLHPYSCLPVLRIFATLRETEAPFQAKYKATKKILNSVARFILQNFIPRFIWFKYCKYVNRDIHKY